MTDIYSLPGWCTPEKGALIDQQLADLSSRGVAHINGVEIGVFGGRSLLAAGLALKRHGIPGYILGVDPYDAGRATACLEGTDHYQWWSQIPYNEVYTNALKAIYDNGLCNHCGILRCSSRRAFFAVGKPLSYLHIDGNHSRYHATQDVDLWVPLVEPGGVILLDDADNPGWPDVKHVIPLIEKTARLIGILHGTAVFIKS